MWLKGKKQLINVEKDKSWNLAAAIWYVKRINVVEKVKKQLIDMLRRIKVET